MTIFKRCFGNYLSMAKAQCERDALKFEPSSQKLRILLDIFQKTAKEALGVEAPQFRDKDIDAKVPDHVKKILNRAYLEDKPYNAIVLHLEREMRLNGIGAPDEVTLIPLNQVEASQPTTETEHGVHDHKKGYCFYCNKFGTFNEECRKMKTDKLQQNRKKDGTHKL